MEQIDKGDSGLSLTGDRQAVAQQAPASYALVGFPITGRGVGLNDLADTFQHFDSMTLGTWPMTDLAHAVCAAQEISPIELNVPMPHRLLSFVKLNKNISGALIDFHCPEGMPL